MDAKEDENSANVILVDRILHVRTIVIMSMERTRYKLCYYCNMKNPIQIIVKGSTIGPCFLAQVWRMEFMFWWGG